MEEVVAKTRGRNLRFSTDVAGGIRSADIIFVAVNTPTKTYGVGAGRAADLRFIESVARTIAQKLNDYTGQAVPVDNRPGANGTIAAQMAARAAPDAHTLLFSTQGHSAIAAAISGARLGFDPFKDLAPIALLVNSTQMIVAHPGLNVKTIPELVKLANSKKNLMSYGSSGSGATSHITAELFRMAIGAAASMPIDEATAIALRNTSLTELVLGNGSWRVERIGDASHLD